MDVSQGVPQVGLAPPAMLAKASKVALRSLVQLPAAATPASCLRYVVDKFESASARAGTLAALEHAPLGERGRQLAVTSVAPGVSCRAIPRRPGGPGQCYGDARVLALADGEGLAEVGAVVRALEACVDPDAKSGTSHAHKKLQKGDARGRERVIPSFLLTVLSREALRGDLSRAPVVSPATEFDRFRHKKS